MNGLSLLSTIVSVLSFPLAFLALLYPQVASPQGRWRGFFFYITLSGSTLLLAALTANPPEITEETWSALDWTIFLLGGGLIMVLVTKKWWAKKITTGFFSSEPKERDQEGGRVQKSKKKKKGEGKGK